MVNILIHLKYKSNSYGIIINSLETENIFYQNLNENLAKIVVYI